ncbi:MAG: glycosyltransferase family 4 protein [Chloroflexota bacterium]
MRVGFLTYGMADQLTGIGRYAVELTYALRQVNLCLEIVLLNPYPESSLPWYRDFPTYSVPSLRRLPGVLAWGSAVLAAAAQSLCLDILHDPCGIAPFAAPRRGVRRVVTIHDAIPHVYPRTQPLLTQLVFRTLIPMTRWTADAILTDSESARRDLIRTVKLPACQIQVAYPGVQRYADDQLMAWRTQRSWLAMRYGLRCPYFLVVGALTRRKNLPRLLAAFRRLLVEHEEVKLVLVGPEKWWADETLVAARSLGESVYLTGFVDDETLHRLYANATALVFPSLYEGFGLPVLEAMAHGTPAIASTASSLPEVLGDAGIAVDPFDVGAIAGAMRTILENPTLAGDLAQWGRARASTFTWERTARETARVYEEVLR